MGEDHVVMAARLLASVLAGGLIGLERSFRGRPATIATALTILVLSIFRWVESHMRTQSYARLDVAFRREEAIEEAALRTELAGHGFDAARMHFRLTESSDRVEYRMMIQTTRPENFSKLAKSLSANHLVKEFRIAPTGD